MRHFVRVCGAAFLEFAAMRKKFGAYAYAVNATFALCLGVTASVNPARAQDYPSKPLQLLVTTAPRTCQPGTAASPPASSPRRPPTATL